MVIERTNANNDKIEIALENVKSHDSNKRIQGIKLFIDMIKTDYIILSVDMIRRLQLAFECEHNIEVLLQLSKSCTNLGLISLFEDKICQLNINEFDFFSKGCIINTSNEIIYNAYKNYSTEDHTSKSKSDRNLLLKIEKIMSIVPILQDIAELDDVYVRMETLKSLKSLINIITFIIEEYLNSIHGCAKYNELKLMFNKSLEIFQKLANSDILSHKILSCHIIPLILEQKRLSEIFDEKNILLTKYSDFCVHPAPMLRKHASKVFNYILEQIEIEEGIIEILVFPMIRNFCCDEQEGVRLIAIKNIEAFFLQITELAQSKSEYIKNVFIFFEKLQPFIFILYNDVSWRIRSSVSKPIINIYSKLFHLVNLKEAENVNIYSIKDPSTNVFNKAQRIENLNTEYYENGSQNLHVSFDENNMCSHPQSKNNSDLSNKDYLDKLALILTQLLMDQEPETRISTLSNILRTVEEQILKSKSIAADNKLEISYIPKLLFYDVIIKEINNKNSLLTDQNVSVRINLSRIIKMIILIKVNFEIDEYMNIELENAFDNLVAKLIHDEDGQVRQSAVLALCSGVSESIDTNFLINKIILPHSGSIIKDNFWRVRYCSVIFLTLSLYKLLSSHFDEEEIWNGKINKNLGEGIQDFLNCYKGTIDVLIELIIVNIRDKTSIVRQLTSIFSLPLLSFWFGFEWTKNQLWNKNILPMITSEKSYMIRITGLLSANSIMSGMSIRSFKELLDVIKHIIQLIFIVAPTFDSINEEPQNYQDPSEENNNYLSLTRNEVIDENTDFFVNNGSPRRSNFCPHNNHLAEYLPLINASNLILSLNPSKTNGITIKPKISSFDYELQLEIISVILQYSVNDIVPNVRIKAFQTIDSIMNRNRLGSFQKSVIDQVKYSYENDPDHDVRTYCRYILRNSVKDEIELGNMKII
ncbi:protein phosphatase regulator like HEAT repeat-containing protein [Cryptosporidium ubiquitum]|uniref:Protein phosphatase regulator like HEAT repeat-containing protein n=1 Tax=Cryptosporidium ubiquitum TaxID=857276 RepID=A0A1J4MP48_9CRYT|nr:protein phosphatase regulator like HEAT repeat-containing protein [Cryptosporidium ubiquitum]OII74653.1 protein phosphatase regulator like HEAT repeat-containing protein [Cryptosporidium ubiquitum]